MLAQYMRLHYVANQNLVYVPQTTTQNSDTPGHVSLYPKGET